MSDEDNSGLFPQLVLFGGVMVTALSCIGLHTSQLTNAENSSQFAPGVTMREVLDEFAKLSGKSPSAEARINNSGSQGISR